MSRHFVDETSLLEVQVVLAAVGIQSLAVVVVIVVDVDDG